MTLYAGPVSSGVTRQVRGTPQRLPSVIVLALWVAQSDGHAGPGQNTWRPGLCDLTS